MDRDVAGHDPDLVVTVVLAEVAVLLVRERLDGARVDDAAARPRRPTRSRSRRPASCPRPVGAATTTFFPAVIACDGPALEREEGKAPEGVRRVAPLLPAGRVHHGWSIRARGRPAGTMARHEDPGPPPRRLHRRRARRPAASPFGSKLSYAQVQSLNPGVPAGWVLSECPFGKVTRVAGRGRSRRSRTRVEDPRGQAQSLRLEFDPERDPPPQGLLRPRRAPGRFPLAARQPVSRRGGRVEEAGRGPGAPRLRSPAGCRTGLVVVRLWTGAFFLVTAVVEAGPGRLLARREDRVLPRQDYVAMIERAIARPPELFGAPLGFYADFLETVMLPGRAASLAPGDPLLRGAARRSASCSASACG